MPFNSIGFVVFLPVVFLFYWFIFGNNRKIQNLFIVVVSYFFYACWDWRFLGLIAFCSLINYFSGLGIENAGKDCSRKVIMWICSILSLGLLGVFKYFNFFIDTFVDSFALFGIYLHPFSLKIILPVGISFYTFQSLGYTIDVYKNRIKACRDIVAFFAFISFFPQLLAGPIERANQFLPQFFRARCFDYTQTVDGLKQILWGFFKKVVIADRCAYFVDLVYGDVTSFSGSTLILVMLLYSFQIYGDFSGYSDIAIGTARLFGFSLKQNFAYPNFARDIAEFWRRWHISLTTWFKDYLYIPIGGSKGGLTMKIRNTFIVFFLSAFWHGADYSFLVWGVLNFIYFLPLLLRNKNRRNMEIVALNQTLPTWKEIGSIMLTFLMVAFARIFFRAPSIWDAWLFIKGIFNPSLFSLPSMPGQNENLHVLFLLFALGIFTVIEWIGRREQYAIETIGNGKPRLFRWIFYSLIIFVTGIYMQTGEMAFVYFQF